MISLCQFPHTVMEEERPLNPDYPSYCLHCHVKIENDRHLETHSAHGIHSLQEVEVKLKSNLNLTLSKIETQRTHLSQLQRSMEEFNESYNKCKDTVQATAKEMCSKIMAHEKRLIEELDMYREIEYRKVGLSGPDRIQSIQQKLDTLSHTCQALLAEAKQEHFLEHLKQSRENMNLAMLDVSTGNLDLKNIQSTVIDFTSIRCNTAFGTVSATKPKQMMKRRVSMKHIDSIPMFAPASDQPLESFGKKSPRETDDSDARLTPIFNKGAKFLQRKLSLQNFNIPTRNSFFSRDVERKSPSPEMTPSPLAIEQFLLPFEENDEHLQLLWIKDSEGPAPGQINCPTDVTFLPDQTLVVCDRGNMRLQLFNTDGQLTRVLGEKKIKPYRVNTTASGQILLTDSKDSCVKVFDRKGHSVFTLGKKSLIASTSFKAPCAVAQNNKKQYLVSDLESNQVTLYSRDGKVQSQMDFKKPSYISTDKDGRILVSDNLDHCVKVYDSSFEYLFQCTLTNHLDDDESENCLTYPTGGCFDDEGNIYLADWGRHTVTMFNKDGMFVKQLLSKQDGLYHPAGIAVSSGFFAITNFSESHSSVMLYRLL